MLLKTMRYGQHKVIVLRHGKPYWKDQPIEPDGMPNTLERYYFNMKWPSIDFQEFNKFVGKKLIVKGSGGWVISEKGLKRTEHRRSFKFFRWEARPTLSKYRKRKLRNEERKARWEAYRNPEVKVELPPRKEIKKTKFWHDGWRRHYEKTKERLLLKRELEYVEEWDIN